MNSTKTPFWFWLIAVVAILWNLMGVYSFFAHTFISEEALANLSEAERGLYESFPTWASIAFAIAVFTGLIGSIGLTLKKTWIYPVFIISLIAIVLQMSYYVFFSDSIEVYGMVQTLAMPIMVIVFAAFLIWFSTYVQKFNWYNKA